MVPLNRRALTLAEALELARAHGVAQGKDARVEIGEWTAVRSQRVATAEYRDERGQYASGNRPRLKFHNQRKDEQI